MLERKSCYHILEGFSMRLGNSEVEDSLAGTCLSARFACTCLSARPFLH